jgi:hypothetical protein
MTLIQQNNNADLVLRPQRGGLRTGVARIRSRIDRITFSVRGVENEQIHSDSSDRNDVAIRWEVSSGRKNVIIALFLV